VTDDPGGNTPEYPEIDLSVPQFTVRAILTGMTTGAVLSLCNIYAGLKIGWGFNMSIAAALLSYGFWQSLKPLGARDWNKLENNINQTAASSAASISSAGLVAPIPALTILTGKTWSWLELFVWCLSVSIVGVVVAIGLRRQMLIVDKLPFPNGIATAETLDKMCPRYRGPETSQSTASSSAGSRCLEIPHRRQTRVEHLGFWVVVCSHQNQGRWFASQGWNARS
jgi:uncharacterized oligopeptide transporter (OPT) family protein